MAEMTDDQIAQISDAIRANQKIEAIKLCREFSGMDLRAAKEYVEALEQHLGGGRAMPAGGASHTDGFSEDEARAMTEALFEGRKIEAIKIYRDGTGKGLKESKQAMDDLERQLRQECPERFTHAASKMGCGLVMFLAGAGAVAGWLVG